MLIIQYSYITAVSILEYSYINPVLILDYSYIDSIIPLDYSGKNYTSEINKLYNHQWTSSPAPFWPYGALLH